MTITRSVFALAGVCALSVASLSAQKADKDKETRDKDQGRRPKVSLTARPLVSISPSRVVLSAELVGGADDNEEFYCADTEWDWGDGTKSEASIDCEPYEAGKSLLKRRFTADHVFRAGNHRITFRLKRRDKVIGSGTVMVEVRPGIRDLEP
jgi:hypothetical protein